jgi:hypothetical protein
VYNCTIATHSPEAGQRIKTMTDKQKVIDALNNNDKGMPDLMREGYALWYENTNDGMRADIFFGEDRIGVARQWPDGVWR